MFGEDLILIGHRRKQYGKYLHPRFTVYEQQAPVWIGRIRGKKSWMGDKRERVTRASEHYRRGNGCVAVVSSITVFNYFEQSVSFYSYSSLYINKRCTLSFVNFLNLVGSRERETCNWICFINRWNELGMNLVSMREIHSREIDMCNKKK